MYQKIMVPLDGSELAECVLAHVESIGKGCGVARVIFVRAIETFSMPPGAEAHSIFSAADMPKINEAHRAEARQYLDQVVRRVNLEGVSVQTEVVTGRSADALADYATQQGVDLIVMATHGRSGAGRWFMGSVADRLIHAACVPVLMVRPPECVPEV